MFDKFVCFQHRVENLEEDIDHNKTGKWKLTIKNLNNNSIFNEIFDGVMICTGHHVFPNFVQFPNQDKFKGKIIHSKSYKKPDGFENMKIVIVGIGNSGVDLAVELSSLSNKVVNL